MLLAVIVFSGCVTTQKATPVNHLQIKVAQLERRLEEREEELNELKYTVERLTNELESVNQFHATANTEVTEKSTLVTATDKEIIRVATTAQDVQRALKRAGYYAGPIDGKIGSGSKKAIVEFQQDHQLKADGIIGKK